MVVENRAGAQGSVGAAYVARSKPDGYTLLMASSVMFVANSLYKGLPYDPVGSFEPVAGVGATSMMFMVSESSPIKSITDLGKAAVAGRVNPKAVCSDFLMHVPNEELRAPACGESDAVSAH